MGVNKMKKKLKSWKNTFVKKIKSIKNKITTNSFYIKISEWFKKNKGYVFMFLSLYILDISTRIATSSIGYVFFFELSPNLFSALWLLFLIFLVKNLKNIYGKLIYGCCYFNHVFSK